MFEQWLEEVDQEFIKATSMGRDDFPDNNYREMFEDGFTPVEALIDTISINYGNEGLYAFNLEGE